jgi:general secretion pathway protein L
MKIVGLYIGAGRFGATVVQRQFGKAEVLDSFSRPFGTDEELVSILQEHAPAWSGFRIVSSLPGGLFAQRALTLPFGDRKRIEKALPFEVEDGLPFPLEDVVLGHLMLSGGGKASGTNVLALLLPREAMRQHLDLLAQAGIDPYSVVPSFAGLAALSAMMPSAGERLLVAGTDLCFAKDGTVLALRSYGSAASGGLRHVLRSFEGEQKTGPEKVVVLAGDGQAESLLTDLGFAVEAVTPELGGRQPADPLSLGIALSADANLRTGEFAPRRADEGARRKRRSLIIAVSIAAVLFAVNVSVKYAVVESSYGKLDRQIRDIYRKTFPDARQTGDPVREMRDKLAEARKRFGALGTGGSALDVMKTVTDDIPKEIRVSFQDFLLEGDRLRLQGEAPSFEAVDTVKAALQKSPLFADVAVQDTRMGVDNKVKFRFDIRLKQAM